MSDTPETDSAIVGSNGQWSFVLKETAQKLERERNQARRERDEALAKIGNIRNVLEPKTGKPVSKKATKPTKRKK